MNNITYSVDMLRVKTYITYSEFNNIEFLINTSYKDRIDKFWLSDKISSFRYNYNIEVGEGQKIYFGFMHNQEKVRFNKVDDRFNFTIEFNPNKVKDNKLLMHLLSISGEWYIRSVDLAFDIPVSVLNIVYDKGNKRNVHIFSNGYDDKTICIGSKKSDLYLKIYNKKKESDLNIVGDLTRIELTKKFEDFPLSNIKLLDVTDDYFPVLYLNKYLYTIDDYKDKTMLAVLYAVQSGFELNMLTRRYREKIKEKLEGGCKIRFDKKTCTQVFRKVLFRYFINNNLVKFR